jgi:hypothetical protein
MTHPKQFVLCFHKQMSEYRWFTDHGSVHRDRTSCRCLARKDYKYLSPDKIQGMGRPLAISVPGVAEGRRHRSFVVVGGLASAGLNVNNNNYDNVNNGAAGLRKSCNNFLC